MNLKKFIARTGLQLKISVRSCESCKTKLTKEQINKIRIKDAQRGLEIISKWNDPKTKIYCVKCANENQIQEETLPKNGLLCQVCQKEIEGTKLAVCDSCKKIVCINCSYNCSRCSRSYCIECKQECTKCQGKYCKTCIEQHTSLCPSCNEKECELSKKKCFECLKLYCEKCVTKCERCKEYICISCFSNHQKTEQEYQQFLSMESGEAPLTPPNGETEKESMQEALTTITKTNTLFTENANNDADGSNSEVLSALPDSIKEIILNKIKKERNT